MSDSNNYQSFSISNQHPSNQPGSNPSNGVSGGVATANNAIYKPVPPPKPLSSPPTYRMPPPPTGAALYSDQPPIPGATCTNYESQAQNLRTHSSKFPVSLTQPLHNYHHRIAPIVHCLCGFVSLPNCYTIASSRLYTLDVLAWSGNWPPTNNIIYSMLSEFLRCLGRVSRWLSSTTQTLMNVLNNFKRGT